MPNDLGVWTAEDCALRDWARPLAGPAGDVIYWYFREVPKLTDAAAHGGN